MSFPAYRPISHNTVILGHVTHVEIQRNLGNSQKTLVNSGGSLTNIVSITHGDVMYSMLTCYSGSLGFKQNMCW